MRYYVDHFQDGRYEIMDTRTGTSIARLYSREVAFLVVESLNDADDAERDEA